MVRIYQHAKFQTIPSMRSAENAQKLQIWSVSLSQNDAKRRKMNGPWPKSDHCRWSGYISRQNFRLFPLMHSPANARKPHIWPVSISQNSDKIRKINKPQLWFNRFWRQAGYISMQNCRPFALCVLWEMSGNLSQRTNRPNNGHGWSDGRTDPCTARWKESVSGFGRTDGCRDGQPRT